MSNCATLVAWYVFCAAFYRCALAAPPPRIAGTLSLLRSALRRVHNAAASYMARISIGEKQSAQQSSSIIAKISGVLERCAKRIARRHLRTLANWVRQAAISKKKQRARTLSREKRRAWRRRLVVGALFFCAGINSKRESFEPALNTHICCAHAPHRCLHLHLHKRWMAADATDGSRILVPNACRVSWRRPLW